MCNLTPINTLCDVKLIMFLFKLVHDVFDMESSDVINFPPTIRPTRLGNEAFRLNIPHVKVECYRSWMLVRGCYTWNSIPNGLRSLTPVNIGNKLSGLVFKKHLITFIENFCDANFESNSPCTGEVMVSLSHL